MGWKRFFQITSESQAQTELLVKTLDQLSDARRQHISDLRVLLDQSSARESNLAGMVRMVMEERFYRPTIATRPPDGAPKPDETLSDVTVFDPEQDGVTIQRESALHKELESEFLDIFKEHAE